MEPAKTNTKKRSELFSEYELNLVECIQRATGEDRSKIMSFVDKLTKSRVQDRKTTNIVTTSPGNTRVEETTLFKFVCQHENDIMAANGSIYMPSDKQVSVISQMVSLMMDERKIYKGKMFDAIAADDMVTANLYKFMQATKKINCNSLPGSFGSEFNPFYDKGNYNTITALNRSLIAHAFSTVEQCIGGNEAIFDEEECINHIIVNIRNKPADEDILKILDSYHLFRITADELFQYYHKLVNQYTISDLSIVKKIISTLTEGEISYLYYMGKLFMVFQKNEEIFRGFFDKLFDVSKIERHPETKAEDLKAIDGDLVIAMQIIAAEQLKGYSDLKNLKKSNSDLYLWFVDVCKYGNQMVRMLDDLMNVIMFYPTDYQHIGTRNEMYRNTVPISDTDSTIATLVKWMLWYSKGSTVITQNSFNITAMGIYFMTKCVEHSLYKYSISYGAREKYAKIMKMKNEFLYVALILYPLKKTYAGIIAIHEGIKLAKYKVDIKGGQLRSSTVCKESLDFSKELIVKHILEQFACGQKISAESLINRVVNFEEVIYNSVKHGEMTFLESSAIKNETEYEKPLSSDYFYYVAWQELFADKYGVIRTNSKYPTLKLKEVTPLFLEFMKDATIREKFKAFKEKYGRWPSAIVLNQMMDKIPPELIPLADIREIIFSNMKPSYLTLEKMNVNVGNEGKKMLLSDIYGNLRM